MTKEERDIQRKLKVLREVSGRVPQRGVTEGSKLAAPRAFHIAL